MKEKKFYLVELLRKLDQDINAEYECYGYRDYEKAKEAIQQATKAIGKEMPLEALVNLRKDLAESPAGIEVHNGSIGVWYKEYDQLPDDVDIQHMDEPLDLDYFQEEETVEIGDGEDE